MCTSTSPCAPADSCRWRAFEPGPQGPAAGWAPRGSAAVTQAAAAGPPVHSRGHAQSICQMLTTSGSMGVHARSLLTTVQPARQIGDLGLLPTHKPARLWLHVGPRRPRQGWHRGSLRRVPRDPLALPTRPTDPLPPGGREIAGRLSTPSMRDMRMAVRCNTLRLVHVGGTGECCAHLQQESEEGHTGVVNTTAPPGAVHYRSKIPYSARLLPAKAKVAMSLNTMNSGLRR
jgi:hypothetical protein